MIASRFVSALSLVLILTTPTLIRAQEATPVSSDSFARTYVVTELKTAEGVFQSSAAAINDAGQVVGFAQRQRSQQAVLWDQGQITELGLLPDHDRGSATSINNAGQIVGFSQSPDYWPDLAVRWENGQPTNLGSLGSDLSEARDINNQGHIVGTSGGRSEPLRAVLWVDGKISDLGTLVDGENSAASAINDAGQIVGWSDAGDEFPRAVRWDQGKITDLGTLGGDRSQALAINATGVIVGWSEDRGGDRHAVRWTNGQIVDLGMLPGDHWSYATGINDRGQIVGRSEGNRETHAVLWDQDQIVDLPGLSADARGQSMAINNAGQIVGESFDRDGFGHAVRWDIASATGNGTASGNPSITVAPARWCVSAGEDMFQGLSLTLVGIFQPRSIFVEDNTVVVPSQGNPTALIGLDLVTGTERWRIPIPESRYGLLIASVLETGNVVFTADGGESESTVGAVDPRTGTKLWSVGIPGSIGSPSRVADGVVYVTAGKAGVFAFDAETGNVIWSAVMDDNPGPVVVADSMTLILGLDDGYVSALDRATGQERWRRVVAIDAADPYDSWTWTGSAGNGVVALTALEAKNEFTGSSVYAINATTGITLWRQEFSGIQASSPFVLDDAVVIADTGGIIRSLDLSTGDERWRRTRDAKALAWIEVGLGKPLVEPRLLVVGFGETADTLRGAVSAIDATNGESSWTISTSDIVLPDTVPWLQDGNLVVHGLGEEGDAIVCAYNVPPLPSA